MITEDARKRKLRDLNRLRGLPNRVDASAARARLELLRQTMSWTDLATATGCSACHLRRILNGHEPRINRITHNKILRAPVQPGGWIFVDALGSRRRIQALQAAGHSQDDIAAAAETTQHRIHVVASHKVQSVRLHFAERITEAYQQLAHTQGGSARGRTIAARNGWLGPAWWDDDEFDNPDYEPTTEDVPRYVAHVENLRELEAQGYTREQIATRLGVTRDTLQRALTFYRERYGEAA